ncbi:hypothetical protein [Rhodanobacter lindaniclasticus]|nr:hypothetical protein [Rhodanobacter lindaniclasticus]
MTQILLTEASYLGANEAFASLPRATAIPPQLLSSLADNGIESSTTLRG